MVFRVKLSAEAKQDLDVILDWLLAEGAGETGLRWWWGLRDAINSLTEFPGRCSLAPEDKIFPFEVRHLLYGRKSHVYRVIFRVMGDVVTFCTSGTVVVSSSRTKDGAAAIREPSFRLAKRIDQNLR